MKFVIISILLVLNLCLAQDSSIVVKNYFQLSIEELLKIDLTIASKDLEQEIDASSSVTVITKKEIQALGVSYLEEVLNFVPGFISSMEIEQGALFRVGARGRSTALSESILLQIDGMRLNDIYSGGAFLFNRFIPVSNIRQVEILRGPGSALYGSNAFMGVINIVTENTNNINLSLGNLSHYSGSASIRKKIDNKILLDANLSFFTEKGYKYSDFIDVYGNNVTFSDPRYGFDFNAKIKYKKLQLVLRHSSRQLNDFLTFGSVGNGVNYEQITQSSFDLNYSKKIKNIQFNLNGFVTKEYWNTRVLIIPKGIELFPGFGFNEDFISGPIMDSYNIGLTSSVDFSLFKNNQTKIGLIIENSGITDLAHIKTHDLLTKEYIGITVFNDKYKFNRETDRTVIGTYIQNKHKFGQYLNLLVGLRIDKYSDFGISYNPRFSISFKPSNKTIFKFLFGEAFRAPNFLELYDRYNPVDFGNPNLKAEKIRTYELIFIKRLSNLNFSTTLYHNYLDNIITFGEIINHPDNPSMAPTFINEGEEKITGLETEIKYIIANALIFRGSYHNLFDDIWGYFPKNTASLLIGYFLPKLSLSLSATYRSKIKNLPVQKDLIIFNSKFTYKITKFISFSIAAKNLLNKKYYTPTTIPFQSGVPNRGREIKFTIQLDY